MCKRTLYFVSFLLILLVKCIELQAKDEIPEGWHKDSNGAEYEVSIDKTIFRSAPKSYSIKSSESATPESGCELFQTFDADKFLGKRIRISLFAKGDIKNYSLLYLCVGSKGRVIRGVNELITSSVDWKNYTVVIDVAENVTYFRYGVTLSGRGQIWFDDLNIEIVGKDVPEKNVYFPTPPKMDKPYNLP